MVRSLDRIYIIISIISNQYIIIKSLNKITYTVMYDFGHRLE